MFNALYNVEMEIDNTKVFDFREMMNNPDRNYDDMKYRKLRDRLIELQNEFYELNQSIYHDHTTGDQETKIYNNRMRYQTFYQYTKNELLLLCPDIEKLIDWVLIIYYADKRFAVNRPDKSILWNCFGHQLIMRAKGKHRDRVYKTDKLTARAVKLRKMENKNRKEANRISDRIFKGLKCFIYKTEIAEIHKQFIDDLNCQRLAFALLAIYRILDNRPFKIESNKRDSLTPSQLCKLSGLNWYTYQKCMEILTQHGTIQIDKYNRCKVNVTEIKEGKEIEISDINMVQHLTKRLFRYERSGKETKYD